MIEYVGVTRMTQPITCGGTTRAHIIHDGSRPFDKLRVSNTVEGRNRPHAGRPAYWVREARSPRWS